MATQPNIVLVHGAWTDGSTWSGVIPLLQADGYHVVAAQLPLTSLADDVAVTRRLLADQEGPTILVGHSYGGSVITVAGDIPTVVGLVYVAAYAPDVGENAVALNARYPLASGAASIRPRTDGYLWVEPAQYQNALAHDVDEMEAAIMAAAQRPVRPEIFYDPTNVAAWKSRRSWYQVSSADRMVPPELQQWMAHRINAQVVTLPASHMPMVSYPGEIAALITTAAKQCAA
ncbi:MAG TPA: alpha/beta hydrolase [Gemmatimonadaceae bacterium]|jgi:pimeloyl-ACP methyl ester carboxylesterase|nr:alpha/beta hydrolase [Gemmatimonadaceae bacterium]